MRTPSLKRNLLFATLITFAASSLLAVNPSARYETRMAYDAKSTHMILFGGLTGVDSGTKKAYWLGDTWEWTGSRWIQRFPEHVPPARSGQAMVDDSARQRIVMWGGRNESTVLNDTWVYQNSDWTQIDAPESPSARVLPGAAYDPQRDRVLLFGGTVTNAEGTTLTPLYDTWEFDGSTWTKVADDGPKVTKPLLAYDMAREQTVMLGMDTALATVMYTYDVATASWTKLTPATVPPCINEGTMVYQAENQTVLYTGGICSGSSAADDTYEWDGSDWAKVEVLNSASRLFGAALAYDASRELAVMFGGSGVIGGPTAATWLYSSKAWITLSDSSRPDPRSLFAFTTDPVRGTIWMYGGTDGVSALIDFWQYHDGTWQRVSSDATPSACITPNGAFDSDREKFVLACADGSVFEWDGESWKSFSGMKTVPPYHQFSSMAYDPTLKKTVLFGGYDGASYLDQTWLWDGTTWTREKHNPAPARTLAAMWYDPTLKKVVLYGGLGRITRRDRITRYQDMWTFNGNGWSELKPASGTPGMRYGSQIVVDPRTNHLLLFGGLRVDSVPPVPPATEPTQVQVYVDDMWEWDGSAWSRLQPDSVPPARENGRIAFDPSRDELVLFGGYAGHFFSDTWAYNPNAWEVKIFDPLGPRRRVAR